MSTMYKKPIDEHPLVTITSKKNAKGIRFNSRAGKLLHLADGAPELFLVPCKVTNFTDERKVEIVIGEKGNTISIEVQNNGYTFRIFTTKEVNCLEVGDRFLLEELKDGRRGGFFKY